MAIAKSAGTVEEFIDRLRADGVEAGQEAAGKIRAEAEQQARQVVADAELRAEKIVAAATAEREKILARAQTELRLAARDTLTNLRGAIDRALTAVLAGAVRSKLEDSEFLKTLIGDVVKQYAAADSEGTGAVTINVSDEMRSRLTHWVLQTFHGGTDAAGPAVELQGSLAGAGFEYSITEGTVEVTADALVAFLADLVSPELHRVLAAAAGDVASDRAA